MFNFKSKRNLVLILVGAGLLSGCNSIQKRDESVPLKPLVNISSKAHSPYKVVWNKSVATGVGKTYPVLAPSVKGNNVIVADAKGNVHSIKKEGGHKVWSNNVGHSITSGVSGSNKALVAGKDVLTLLDASSGKKLWTKNIEAQIFSLPTIHGNTVYIHTVSDSVFALNLSNGNVVWRFNSQGPTVVLRKSSQPFIIDNNVVVGLTSGRVVSLSTLDGSLSWEQEVAIPSGRTDIQRMVDVAAKPVLSDRNLVVTSFRGNVAAIDKTTGFLSWKKPVSSVVAAASHGSNVYVADVKGHVYAFNGATGVNQWHTDLLQGRLLTSPVVQGNNILIGSNDGFVHILDLNGKYVNRIKINSGLSTPPVADGNSLYALSNSGSVVKIIKAK